MTELCTISFPYSRIPDELQNEMIETIRKYLLCPIAEVQVSQNGHSMTIWGKVKDESC